MNFTTSEQQLQAKINAFRLAWVAAQGDPSPEHWRDFHNASSDLAHFVAAHSDVLKFDWTNAKKDDQK